MKKIILTFVLLGSLFITAQEKEKIKGNKDVVTKTNVLTNGFNKLIVTDNLDISLIQGNENSYTLTTDSNLHEVIKFDVKDSVLTIHTTHNIRRSKKLEISLNFVAINNFKFGGEAKIKGEGLITNEQITIQSGDESEVEMDIKASNATITTNKKSEGTLNIDAETTKISMYEKSTLEINLKSDNSNFKLQDYTKLTINGNTKISELSIKDKSRIYSENLENDELKVYASDKAYLEINAKKNLELFMEGKSEIELYGLPEINLKAFKGKAKLIKK